MEGLAGAASVIAVIEISGKISSLCWKYLSSVKDAKEDIKRLLDEVEALRQVLQQVHDLVERSGDTELPVSRSLSTTITQCLSNMKDLKKTLDPGKGRKSMSRFGIRALKWPLTTKYVNKTFETLQRYKTTFIMALNVDQA